MVEEHDNDWYVWAVEFGLLTKVESQITEQDEYINRLERNLADAKAHRMSLSQTANVAAKANQVFDGHAILVFNDENMVIIKSPTAPRFAEVVPTATDDHMVIMSTGRFCWDAIRVGVYRKADNPVSAAEALEVAQRWVTTGAMPKRFLHATPACVSGS